MFKQASSIKLWWGQFGFAFGVGAEGGRGKCFFDFVRFEPNVIPSVDSLTAAALEVQKMIGKFVTLE